MLLPRAFMVLVLLAAGSRISAQESPRPAPAEPPSPRQAQPAPKKPQPTTAQLVDRILRLLDKNKDGKISREEAKGSPLEVVFDRLDRNHDGVLDRTELMQGRGIMGHDTAAAPAPATTPATRPLETAPAATPAPAKNAPAVPPGMHGVVQDDVRLFLKKYDANGDGKIDLGELRSVFADVDRDRDGQVDKAELRQGAERLVAPTKPPAPNASRTSSLATNAAADNTHGTSLVPTPKTTARRSQPTPEQVKPSTLDILILHLVRHYDIDKSGKLGWDEVQALFHAMDRNHDNALDADEMLQGILALWAPAQAEPASPTTPAPRAVTSHKRATAPIAEALADALLGQYDANHDGRLDALEWKTLFESLDTTHRGTLSRPELRRLFAQLLAGPNAAPAAAPAANGAISVEGRVSFVLTMYDTNGDGRISAEEAATTPLAKVFKQIDRDGDGYLSRQELMQAAKLLPIPKPTARSRSHERSPR